MSNLMKEIDNTQNPALGAYIIWNFIRGYYSNKSEFVPMPLLFIVLPIVLREEMTKILFGTQKPSGLRIFSDKFSSSKSLKSDVLSQIQSSAINMKNLTLESIKIAISSSLISFQDNSALLIPISTTEHKNEPASIKKLGKASEKLGFWCSKLTLIEISNTLKVRF